MNYLDEEYQFLEPIFTQGQASLYLGNIYAVQDLNLLDYHKIGAVVTVCREAQILLPESIYHLKMPITDRPDFELRETIEKSNQFIEQHIVAGRNVLVHCFMGKSRSTSLIASYLMLSQNINLEQALNLLKSKAPQCEPNPGFIRQLLLYERQIQGGISSTLTKKQSQYYKVQDYPGMQATKQAPLKKVNVMYRDNPSKISHRVKGQGMTNNAFCYKNTLTLPNKLHQIALSHYCDLVTSPLFSSKNKDKKLELRLQEDKKVYSRALQANLNFYRGSTPILIQ